MLAPTSEQFAAAQGEAGPVQAELQGLGQWIQAQRFQLAPFLLGYFLAQPFGDALDLLGIDAPAG
ncbi:MAG: hypothetical protein HY238_00445 [Acidobacteria bacterium]|nr:hypothetical protein [Acidobacteriota bacterium]